ncbi:MAG: hypothetical protein Q8P07_00970 [bacterium]|nr:hypothetical protein [bacterium]
MAKEEKMAKEKRKTPQVNQDDKALFEEFVDYLSRVRTADEIMKKLKINDKKLDQLLKTAATNGKHRIFKQEDQKSKAYILIPTSGEVKEREKIWSSVRSSVGQPTLGIIFPSELHWSKMRIVFFGNVEFGGNCDEQMLDERINWISREPHVFAIFNGDCFAKKFEVGLGEAVNRLRHKLAPIAHKILWMQQGCNEEAWAKKNKGIDMLGQICADLNIEYFTGGQVHAEIHWADSDPVTFFCLHGTSVAEKKGSKLNAGLRPFGWLEHTCYVVVSHMTDSMFKKVERFKRDQLSLTLPSAKQFLVIAPSLGKYFGTTLAKKGAEPSYRGQINAALYKNGDYHLYAGSKVLNLKQLTFEQIIGGNGNG